MPSDVICSPTRLYHHCRNTINHTFHHTGGYCVNVTVMNTVSFAEKSININVDGDGELRVSFSFCFVFVSNFLVFLCFSSSFSYSVLFLFLLSFSSSVFLFFLTISCVMNNLHISQSNSISAHSSNN